MIIIRTLRRDIANYNKEDEMVCFYKLFSIIISLRNIEFRVSRKAFIAKLRLRQFLIHGKFSRKSHLTSGLKVILAYVA